MSADRKNNPKRYHVIGKDAFVASGPPEEWGNAEFTIDTFDTLEEAIACAEQSSRDTSPLASPSLRDTCYVRDDQTSTVVWRS